MKQTFGILLLLLSSILSLHGQNYDKKWGLNIDYGSIQYRGELGDQFFDFTKWQSGYGVGVSRYLTPSFDVGVRLGYNFLSVSGPGNQTFSMNGNLYSLLAGVEYKFANGATMKENALLKPYIKASGGMIFGQTWGSSMDLNGAYYSLPLNDFVFSLKGGTKVRINENINAFLELGNLWVTALGMDGSTADIASDQFLQLNIGVSFSIGVLKDKDHDGVVNKLDQCPNTPTSLVVDALGCPLDTEGDGLADYLDECPDQAGGASTKGCPDKDQDGLADKYDTCPDEAGPKSNGGCPFEELSAFGEDELPQYIEEVDDERDVQVFYVYQNEDTNPVVFSSEKNTGMAYDKDGDGVSDNIDMCPTEVGSIENYGCPEGFSEADELNAVVNLPLSDIAVKHGCPADIDCDGITDDFDKCPESPGSLRNMGCPVEKMKPSWKMELDPKSVHFMSGRSFLTEYSKARVDKVVSLLRKNSKLNVWMLGHTDPSGPSDVNLTISEKRIQTIVDYMVAKGISKERMFSIGLGESFPVSIVFSTEGQLLNRRVDFYLFEFE
ncbi:MAG: OmpA family protein [Prolixibacteraceae bacterium]|jgi:OOP family OmpA-OmpF porin|nr:OmpA family protein [Prolixibacteraceae bacterium]